MTIKNKLVLLVAGSLLLCGVAFTSYFIVLAPVDHMQTENQHFQAVVNATTGLRAEGGFLMTVTFTTQIEKWQAAIATYSTTLKRMDEVVLLPQVSETMADAVTAVKNLGGLSTESITAMDQTLVDIATDLKTLGIESQDVVLLDTLLSKNLEASYPNEFPFVRLHIQSLMLNLQNLNEALLTTSRVISEKDAIVTEELAKVRVRSITFVSVLVTIISLAALGLSFLLARSIARSINTMRGTVSQMAVGDLTGRFDALHKDEIGVLGGQLNEVIDTLNRSLQTIKQASGRNMVLRQNLIDMVSESTASSVEINANSQSIQQQMHKLDEMVSGSLRELGLIFSTMRTFNDRLAGQDTHVDESVAAVTQTLASITSIARIVERDQASIEQLSQEADLARGVFEEAFDRMAQITDSITIIQEMASVIANIASQTNILSMNAAIEAAHAGEFGRGFAVVAGEIGKLAAASAASSSEIDQSIRSVVSLMVETGAQRVGTVQSFEGIIQKIRVVSDSVREIYGNIQEMKSGSSQVLQSMAELQRSSNETTGQSTQITTAAENAQITLGSANRISSEVVANITEISLGLTRIIESVHAVSGAAEQIGTVSQDLDQAINTFQTT